jgi:hypothetical protein
LLPPSEFSPIIFQYLCHDQDISSITQAMLTEWHPELAATLRDWLQLGHESTDLSQFNSHFMTFHDQPVSLCSLLASLISSVHQAAAYARRTEASHAGTSFEMLYLGIFGPASTTGREWLAFQEGFNLPCRSGFSFSKVNCHCQTEDQCAYPA